MLHNNKTYDNSNIRDHLQVFNDGVVTFYEADERALVKVKGTFYYSNESISYETYLKASQNSRRQVMAIAIPSGGAVIMSGDIAVIEDKYYMVDHSQFKDYGRPNYYKVYLNETTIPYVNEVEENA